MQIYSGLGLDVWWADEFPIVKMEKMWKNVSTQKPIIQIQFMQTKASSTAKKFHCGLNVIIILSICVDLKHVLLHLKLLQVVLVNKFHRLFLRALYQLYLPPAFPAANTCVNRIKPVRKEFERGFLYFVPCDECFSHCQSVKTNSTPRKL